MTKGTGLPLSRARDARISSELESPNLTSLILGFDNAFFSKEKKVRNAACHVHTQDAEAAVAAGQTA